ncbi:DUF1697 domain-containing protein [Roseisalinus antarcticus]|uniref:DUF1697 domain-containing protein n=1 Tax=Roseisalinus antarcticus TaxID=254357 RepID=A0A1Y5RD24_9RHOB|nr:DUF1697 domain-containing protein [Roseisalinus antarcticus]SLN13796.1 hypothetical protein ROA7023_00084 [Roseisalinus antarcticus]
MTAHVALLRGVNVGGGNKVAMPELRRLAEGLGWTGVQSYIASGNLVFQAADGDLAQDLRGAMRREIGVDVPVLVLGRARFERIAAACPFSPEDGRLAHVYFAFGAPRIDGAALDRYIAPGEALEAGPAAVYLSAPEGIGRSKLFANLGRVVPGTDLTGRNLRTVRHLAGMLRGVT